MPGDLEARAREMLAAECGYADRAQMIREGDNWPYLTVSVEQAVRTISKALSVADREREAAIAAAILNWERDQSVNRKKL